LFAGLSERIENLESVIEQQSIETEKWKDKYKQACENEQLVMDDEKFQLMENKIILVIQENENLNSIIVKQEQEK
jgi:hypothetical protein